MRIWLNIIGGVAFALSIGWILQGTGFLPYGFMANDIKWTFAGQAMELPAVALLLYANLRA